MKIEQKSSINTEKCCNEKLLGSTRTTSENLIIRLNMETNYTDNNATYSIKKMYTDSL